VLTGSVISEVIHESRESLLVVSFAAFGVAEAVQELERAARRGVRIDLVLESTAEHGGTLHGTLGPSAAFEALRARHILDLAGRRPTAGTSRAALHAKLVTADERIGFLGSANLTDKALMHNLEIGVIIRDPDVVRRIVQHFRSLMKPAGPLKPADTT
jgi:putative cardiolipin synthase